MSFPHLPLSALRHQGHNKRKEKFTEMSEPLPQELHIDILVSLPVKSLLRFQCVSKSWKSLIGSTDFISMHTKHNESTDNYAHLVEGDLYRTGKKEEKDFRGELHQFDNFFCEFKKIEFPSQIEDGCFGTVLDCKGLLLFTDPWVLNGDRFERFILWNPAARLTVTLPTPGIDIPNLNFSAHGFGFDDESSDYKVLRMVYGYNGRYIAEAAELFKLRTGAWETVSAIDDFHYVIPKPEIFTRPSHRSQAFVNGATHWVGYHSRFLKYPHIQKELVVLLFRMSSEEFRVMKLPDVITVSKFSSISLGVSGGLLCVIHYNGVLRGNGSYNGCCVWLMKEYGVIESWTKQCTIDLRDEGGLWETISFRNKRVLLVIVSKRKNSKKLGLYDPKTNRFLHHGIRSRSCLNIMNTYVESLVLLDQKVNAVPNY
jgi:F-box interacting protein